jgi:hypothetical protein
MKQERISRLFETQRGDFTMYYPFATFSYIFTKQENPLLQKLCNYFQQLIIEGKPDSEGRKSVSAGKMLANITLKQDNSHPLIDFAKDSDYRNRERFQHKAVQSHLMKFDDKMIAQEIPVWDDDWIGHIDGLRFMGDHIELFDFKPNAHKEKKASSQVYRYRNLLSKRTGIPEASIKTCYFDDTNLYFLTV